MRRFGLAVVAALIGGALVIDQGADPARSQEASAPVTAPLFPGDTPVGDLLPPALRDPNRQSRTDFLMSRPAQEGEFFGRHGALTEREMAMARTAWQYFVNSYQEDTGLVNAVGSYPSTTLWDTASYISGLVAAHELGIIDKREFDRRATKLIGTLRNLDLYRGEAPNKVYNTQTGEKVNYANQPGEVGFSVLDMGRMLVWLRILKERYPYLANGVDNVPMRWNYCNIVADDGRLFGSIVGGDNQTRYVQEGRLGYEEYAAKGFALWGFDVTGALDPHPLKYTNIYDVDVPYDGRDPRVFHNQNYVLTESYLLDGLEMGWDLPVPDPDGPGVASQGWRAEFAHRIFLVQQRRFEATGIITARSEHQVEGKPYFVYDSIFADGYPWNTLDPSDVYQPDRAAVASKAALGMWALWDVPYTDLLFDTVADLSDPEGGFYEGLYENGNGYIPLRTANNNGIILAALLYKAQGPIMRFQNDNTSYWDTAYAGTDIRANKCLPDKMVVEATCCACAAGADIQPTVPWDEFKYCRPLDRENGIAATECRPEEQAFAKPEPRVVLPAACRAEWAAP
ncbi:DUF3131 domain-containing protein [Paracoccus zeaxanthinifaciens]|uniref:DUF3131 domain-containing protein n=1 Tax=Paracoccus zeaxanthinifaciens TaxID=187400 RepID=UPI0003B40BC5|nr:DUF3131 domain-containing protein [Paracoccus zeaxanthinifaciens]